MSRLSALLSAILLCTAFSSHAADDAGATPARECRHRNADIEQAIGYCQAVRVGNTLHVSGVTSDGPMDQAIGNVYTQLERILADNGLSLRDVVKENLYATDLDAMIRHGSLRKPFYGDTLPAATWVQVERLFMPSFVLEVEVVAQYPQR
jgi:2-iminobutanoate/2-iminopropanoate deaminase